MIASKRADADQRASISHPGRVCQGHTIVDACDRGSDTIEHAVAAEAVPNTVNDQLIKGSSSTGAMMLTSDAR